MQLEGLLRRFILFGIFAMPFVPFLVTSSMFFPFVTGKVFAFRILVELVFGAWVLLALLNVRYRPKLSGIFYAILAFVAVIFVADLFGENPFKSFWSNFERMEGWFFLIHLLLYFIVTASVLHTEKLWAWFAGTSIGASVAMGLYGVIQLSGLIIINQGGSRLDGTFGNATYLAIYMLFHVFITGLLLLRWKTAPTIVRIALLLAIALQLFIMIQTATRGAILGLVGGALVTTILIALFEKDRPKLRKIAVGVLIAIIVLVGGFFAIKDTELVQSNEILERVASISLEQKTVKARFLVWGMAWEGVKERPLLGWGQENFNYVFNTYYNPQMFDQEPWFDRVHNILLDWIIAGGIPGLVTYLLIPLSALFYLWFARRGDEGMREAVFSVSERALITGMLLAYGFHNLFVFDNVGSYLIFFAVLAYIHFRATPKLPREHWLLFVVPKQIIHTVVAPIVIIATAVLLYFVNIPSIVSAQNLISAQTPQENGIQENIAIWEDLLKHGATGKQEVREQLLQFSQQLIRNTQMPVEVRQQLLDLATFGMQEELGRAPNDARLFVFMGSFLNNLGFPEDGRPYLEQALELSPTKQDMFHALAATYVATENYDEANALYQSAFELAPNNDIARIRWAVGEIYAGNAEFAEGLLVEEFGTDVVNNGNLLQAYIDTEQFEKVLDIWKIRVAEEPRNPQVWFSLAAAHLRVKEQEEAIEALEQFKILAPQETDRADAIIEEIRAGRAL